MALSNAAREALEWIVDYLEKGTPPDTISMPDEVAHKISVHHSEFGYVSQIKLLEELKDSPTLTLLKILLHIG